MKRTKTVIFAFACVAALLAAVIALNAVLFSFGKKKDNTLTDFSETEYFTAEADYNEYLKSNGLTAGNEESDKKFVSAAIKKVGEETQSERSYFLYLELKVEYDPSASVFHIGGRAHWDDKVSYAGIKTAEGTSEDCLAITWGGAGGLCATDKNMYGKYYGSDETEIFSTRNSDSYNGFVWQFKERNGLYGKIMEEGLASVTLKPVEANITVREAGVRLTYIHTAHKTDYRMMTVDYGRGGSYAPRILYETIGNSWTTELCIENLSF